MAKRNKLFDDIPEDILMEAAASVAEYAKRENFALGIPIVILKGRNIVEVYPDGREKVISKIKTRRKKAVKKAFQRE